MLSRSIRTAASRPAQLSRPVVARSFHNSPRSLALSEQDHHKDESDRKSEIDKHKQDTLNKQGQGSGEWKRELASNSEAAVKADRQEIKASDENIRNLQKETEKQVEQEKKGK